MTIREVLAYITADVHGYYTEFHKALDEAGYFTDPGQHKPIILGVGSPRMGRAV